MCGIAGLIDYTGANEDALRGTAARMAAALRHRGPDDAGVWVDAAAGVALGHRRLSVVELSELGHQPMTSACGRYVITFNGEIYNFKELRHELRKHRFAFRGGSDTEVLLAAICNWGIEGALARVVGMFAFALWDRSYRRLYLARDRFGEKPLYYGSVDGAFVFASELAALQEYPGGLGDLDQNALALYLRFAYVPTPHSIYSRISKLPRASLLRVEVSGKISQPREYWSVEEAAKNGIADPICDCGEAVEELNRLLREAIRLQTAADVPVGAFLSGGIDSATIVALMCEQARQVRTFSIGYSEQTYNEAPAAQAVAEYLGTQHTQLCVSPADAMEVIPQLPKLYSEPFADSSQIPTYLVAQLARQDVTVSLSGDGGDELFGGYNRYLWAKTISKVIGPVPLALRRSVSRTLESAFAEAVGSAVLKPMKKIMPRRTQAVGVRDKLCKVAELFRAPHPSDVYLRLLSHWHEPNTVLNRPVEATLLPWGELTSLDLEYRRKLMLVDSCMYLPDDILVKLDRATMGVGLESRAPFLDHRIVEFSWRIPTHMLIRKGEGKRLLRQVLGRYVPKAFVDRPKRGFAVPVGTWIRGPLRHWAEDLLSKRALQAHGLFNTALIRRTWQEHLSGKHNRIGPLWTVLMFQSWYAHQASAAATNHACELETTKELLAHVCGRNST